ncbi:MAG TPA: hypothetical protein VKW06_20720 [Candidatus Angelobacter sp.]|nr:hypothetical protein [Candidatus Angelobacter sp.]
MRAFGLLALVIVLGVGAYIYMHQAQSVAPIGSNNLRAAADVVGVKNDLLAIAQAERLHNASHGDYVSIEQLRSQGELTMTRDNRGPYAYSAEVSDSSFRIVATYSGSDPAMPRSLSIDGSMEVHQEFGNVK